MTYRLVRFKRSVLARCLSGCLMGAVVSVVSAQALADSVADPLADVQVTADSIVFFPSEGYGGFDLRVSGPEGVDFEAQFGGQSSPFFDMGTGEAAYPDGQYTYELTARPVATAQADAGAANSRGDALVSDSAPTQSGYFSIIDGAIVGSSSEDSFAATATDDSGLAETQVFAEDLIVQGSACVGLDCANGENFGFDTMRLKENNLRIHFDDTSASASFPSNDWRIIINDSANGGASYFAVEDSTAGTVPFRVVAGAGNNALYVDDNGDVGVGTSTPAVELQVTDGDSPTLRLEQNGSSGWTPQTWDIAGNETNFFVRDVTNSSKLPFRIRPGAPDNSIYVDTDGDVGMGTASPGNSLHVKRSDGTAKVLIEEANSTVSNRALLELKNQGSVRVILNDADAVKSWTLKNADSGSEFKITESGGGANEFTLDVNGNLTIAGTLTQNSDRDTKENFVSLNPRQILEKVAAMPVSRWNFKFDDDGVQHIGPMAQDFHAAFGLGANARSIAPLDTSGVALAAVQGLYAMLQEKGDEIARLEARLAENEVLLQAQQQQLSLLETQTQRLAALEAAVAAFARLQGSGSAVTTAVTTGFIAD